MPTQTLNRGDQDVTRAALEVTPYKPQKALYGFDFAKPGDAKTAFG